MAEIVSTVVVGSDKMIQFLTIPIFTVTKMVSVATVGAIAAKFFTHPKISSAGISVMRVKAFLPAVLCATLAGNLNMEHLRMGYGWAWVLCLIPMLLGHFLGRFFMRFIPEKEFHGLFLLSTTFQNCISYGMGITQSLGSFAGSNVAGGFPWITAAARAEFPRVVFMWNLPHNLAVWGIGTIMVRNGKKREIRLNYERDLKAYEDEKERRARARHQRRLERFADYHAAKEMPALPPREEGGLKAIAPMMPLDVECPRLDRDCVRPIPIPALLRAEEEERRAAEANALGLSYLSQTQVGGDLTAATVDGIAASNDAAESTRASGLNRRSASPAAAAAAAVGGLGLPPLPPSIPPPLILMGTSPCPAADSNSNFLNLGGGGVSPAVGADPLFSSSIARLRASGGMVINADGDLITAAEAAEGILKGTDDPASPRRVSPHLSIGGGGIGFDGSINNASATVAPPSTDPSSPISPEGSALVFSSGANSNTALWPLTTTASSLSQQQQQQGSYMRRKRRMKRSGPEPKKLINLREGEYSDDDDLVPPVKPYLAPAVTGRALVREFFVECTTNITILASWVGLALSLFPPLKWLMDHTILGDIIIGSLAAIGGANLPMTLLQLGTGLIANQKPKKKTRMVTVRETVFDKETGQFSVKEVTKEVPPRMLLLEWIDSMEIPFIFVALTALIRLVIVPAVFLGIFVLLRKAGNIPIIGPIPSSKAFQFTVLIESCGPTDINCSSLCAMFNYKTVPYSQALLCIYIISIFTTATWLSIYLRILED